MSKTYKYDFDYNPDEDYELAERPTQLRMGGRSQGRLYRLRARQEKENFKQSLLSAVSK